MESDKIEQGTALILSALEDMFGLDPNDANFRETPQRVSRMYKELLEGMGDTQQQVDNILASAFPCNNNQLVLVKNIEAFSLCPHHLLPVHYAVHVAYIPCGAVVGISKLPRLVNLLARRLVLQEQLVEDVTEKLMTIPGCLGAACVAEGRHYCMIMRGAKQSQAVTITSSLRGSFKESQSARMELMELLR